MGADKIEGILLWDVIKLKILKKKKKKKHIINNYL
jgi:hypothetical protein